MSLFPNALDLPFRKQGLQDLAELCALLADEQLDFACVVGEDERGFVSATVAVTSQGSAGDFLRLIEWRDSAVDGSEWEGIAGEIPARAYRGRWVGLSTDQGISARIMVRWRLEGEDGR